MSVIDEVAAERERQIEEKGFTPERDDFLYRRGELRMAGISYALRSGNHGDTPIYAGIGLAPLQADRNCGWIGLGGLLWPWPDWEFPYHETQRARLVKAAALLVAEIEQMDRAALKTAKGTGE